MKPPLSLCSSSPAASGLAAAFVTALLFFPPSVLWAQAPISPSSAPRSASPAPRPAPRPDTRPPEPVKTPEAPRPQPELVQPAENVVIPGPLRSFERMAGISQQ